MSSLPAQRLQPCLAHLSTHMLIKCIMRGRLRTQAPDADRPGSLQAPLGFAWLAL